MGIDKHRVKLKLYKNRNNNDPISTIYLDIRETGHNGVEIVSMHKRGGCGVVLNTNR